MIAVIMTPGLTSNQACDILKPIHLGSACDLQPAQRISARRQCGHCNVRQRERRRASSSHAHPKRVFGVAESCTYTDGSPRISTEWAPSIADPRGWSTQGSHFRTYQTGLRICHIASVPFIFMEVISGTKTSTSA